MKLHYPVFLFDKKWQCGVCTKSKSSYEYAVEKEILKYTTNYIAQCRFNGCRNPKTKYPLSFDFYIKDLRCVIEVDGEQHYKPTSLRGVNLETATAIYNTTCEHDEIKTKYCIDNNITIYRISYIQVNNGEYKNIISSLFHKN